MKNLKLLIGIAFISMLFFSCSNNSNQKKSEDSFDDIVVDNMDEMIETMPMPASYEIIQLLNKSGAGYVFDITNPTDNVDKYITYKQKAINLGIYAADLTYTTTYQKKDETAQYFDNFVQLVSDLEITTLNRQLFESVQNNLDNKDSLIFIIKKAQYDTQKFLNETGKDEFALYALTGSWIEGMYLVGATVKFADNKQPLYNIIFKYEKSLKELIKLMETYKDNENFKDLYKSLNEINDLFNTLEKDKKDLKTIGQLKDKIMDFRNSLI